jgi:hypothetical protein
MQNIAAWLRSPDPPSLPSDVPTNDISIDVVSELTDRDWKILCSLDVTEIDRAIEVRCTGWHLRPAERFF